MGKVVLELKNITKYFPGVVALKDMSLEIREGEVHGLIGENGAGKSTLIKTLTGVNIPEKGNIYLDSKKVKIKSPNDSRMLGIGCVYQELNIVPEVNIVDNIFIGSYIKGFGKILNYKKMTSKTKMIMNELGQDVDVKLECGKLGVGIQQTIEIGKTILNESRIIIMDEPTSSLSENEVKQLMKTIKMLKKKGIAIIFVSHKLEEIFEICDFVTVMRDGQLVSTNSVKDMTKDKLIADMVGRSLDNLFPKYCSENSSEMLRVENLKVNGSIKDISFSAYGGEILGFAGLVGAGRTETMRAIFGIDQKDGGKIYIKGKEVDIKSPSDAINNKIAFLTENRKTEGLVLNSSVYNNLHLATIDKNKSFGLFLNDKKNRKIGEKNIEKLKIKTPSLETTSGSLSGGNQQKVVIAKWINTDAEIYIFDEPTRGIDVGAKIEVYNVMNELVKNGKCVIMVSSELPEILGMSDRVIVMREGKIMAKINRKDKFFNQEDMMKASWGGVLS